MVVESVVSFRKLRPLFPKRALMGNVSTRLLATATDDKVMRAARKTIEVATILAPACGLSTTTLVENIRAMVREVWRQPQIGQLGKVELGAALRSDGNGTSLP